MKNEIRKLLIGTLMAVLSLAGGCGKQSSEAAKGGDSDEQSQGSLETRVDKHGEEIMASTAKAEARVWMKQRSHIFFKAEPKEVAQFVEDFYSAGATQVLIAEIEEHEGTQYGEALLVVLPKDKASRQKLFLVGEKADTAFQNDPVSEKGQKYLYYSLD